MTLSSLLSFVFFLTFATTQEVPALADGRYTVRISFPNGQPDYELEIRGSEYRMHMSGVLSSGKVLWNNGKYLQLDAWVLKAPLSHKPDSTETLGDRLRRSFGDRQMEITSIVGDTLFFKMPYTRNLHVITSSGYLIKRLPSYK
jgi:hypothetical protein